MVHWKCPLCSFETDNQTDKFVHIKTAVRDRIHMEQMIERYRLVAVNWAEGADDDADEFMMEESPQNTSIH